MTTSVTQAISRPEFAREVCNACGQPSLNTICDSCAGRLRADALDRKKREEKLSSQKVGSPKLRRERADANK